MSRYLHLYAPLAFAAAITAACAQPEVDAARALDITGGDAKAEAAREYKRLAFYESAVMHDRDSALAFSEKALAAAGGDLPGPGTPREIADPKARDEVHAAYRRLAMLRAAGADRVAPKASGQAIARLDCWAEQAAEGYQVNDIRFCRDGFQDYAAEAAVALKAAGIAPAVLQAQAFTVTFPSGSSLPSKGEDAVLDAAAKAALADDRARIVLGGHADRHGGVAVNLSLSQARAERVKRLLASRGVPPERISTIGFGETYPRSMTPDGERAAENRRVEIIIGPGGDI